jgi:hypothetical protein
MADELIGDDAQASEESAQPKWGLSKQTASRRCRGILVAGRRRQSTRSARGLSTGVTLTGAAVSWLAELRRRDEDGFVSNLLGAH